MDYLVVDFMPGKDLFCYIQVGGPFNQEIVRTLFRDLVEAVAHVHSRQLVHLDLKLENIFVDNAYSIKLGDFGFSEKIAGHDGEGYFYQH